MNTNIPRPEYPRPQLVREYWQNLNGTWDFEFDFSRSGIERKMYENGTFTREITVPFCPESPLSGIGFTDFMPAVWYRKIINLDADQLTGRLLLHCGAVDYHTKVWVNGQAVGSHNGGYDSFTFEVTKAVREGANEIVIYAEDDCRTELQPAGKQSRVLESRGCYYTRTTGIWQTVWLEWVPAVYISQLHTTPDVANQAVIIDMAVDDTPTINPAGNGNTPNDDHIASLKPSISADGCSDGMTITASASYEGRPMGEVSAKVYGGHAHFVLPLSELYLWEVGQGRLYDLKVSLESGDEVASYFGMRSLAVKNNAMYLNDRPVFQRLVLDQGFYPDGIYTAPTDEALARDIDICMDLGFNGARLHEKVFEERFLYHADRKGYLVWGEHANWGLDITTAQGLEPFMEEWISIVNRDYSHPSIIGWCPFNETWPNSKGAVRDPMVQKLIYQLTKQMDAMRPVIDTSGGFHTITDIYDMHDYEQDPVKYKERYDEMLRDPEYVYEAFPRYQKWNGEPYFISEYGGTWWSKDATGNNWGYGNRPKDEAEVIYRITGLTEVLMQNPRICALCYTQLYDVEQEQNGLYTYSRERKFSDEGYEAIRKTLTQKASIEL